MNFSREFFSVELLSARRHGLRTLSGNECSGDVCARRLISPSLWPPAAVTFSLLASQGLFFRETHVEQKIDP